MTNDEKTICDNDATVPESDMTVPDNQTADGDERMVFIEKGITLLDTYRIESDAIEGGMGKVWRVRHTGWNVDLAMKQPKAALFQSQQQKDNFIHECEAWIGLGLHPHIVSCYYVREINGIPTIFSEWMDGGSLKDEIESGSLYDGSDAEQQERLLDISIQFARGLHYAHECRDENGQPMGLIHQDVKPDNLLLTKGGEAKVADFGISKARALLTALEGSAEELASYADSGGTMYAASGGYTPAYCSMEQMNGQKLTRRTDIYSWAVSVMEMYLGDRLWTNGIIAGAACESYFPEARVAVPEAMKALLKECLNEDEAKRPHDFAVVEEKLLAIYKAKTGYDYPRPASKAAADTADSLNNRALSFVDLGKPKEAERCWEKALNLYTAHPESVYNQLLSMWKRGAISEGQARSRLETICDIADRERMLTLLGQKAGSLEYDRINGLREMLPKQYQNVVTQGISRDGSRLSGRYKEGDACILFVYDRHKQAFLFKKSIKDENRGTPQFLNCMEAQLSLSDDGTYAIYSCAGPNISRLMIWRIADNKCVFTGAEGGGRLSPDNRYYVATKYNFKGYFTNYSVMVFSVKDGQLIHVFESCAMLNRNCRWFTDDGRLIMVKEKTDWVTVDPNGNNERLFTGHEGAAVDFRYWQIGYPVINTVGFSDGLAFSAAADHTVRLWDTETGSFIRTFRNPEITQIGHHGVMTLACMLNSGDYMLGLQGENALIWNTTTGQLMDMIPCSLEDHEKLMAIDGRLAMRYVPRTLSPYALCRIEKTGKRLESDNAFSRLLNEAESLLNAGKNVEALALTDKAMSLAGYERNLRAIRLRQKIGVGLRKSRVRAIVTAPDSALQKRQEHASGISAELKNAAKREIEMMRANAGDDVYSEYNAYLGDAFLSRDERYALFNTNVIEERDSPAQMDIEVTEWHGALVYDTQSGELVQRFGCLYFKDAYGSEYPYTVSFDNSGEKLLVAAKSVSIAYITDGRIEEMFAGRAILCAEFLPDDRLIFCLDNKNTVFIFDTVEKRELGSAFFNGVKNAWLCDADSFALVTDAIKSQLCLIDWEYE